MVFSNLTSFLSPPRANANGGIHLPYSPMPVRNESNIDSYLLVPGSESQTLFDSELDAEQGDGDVPMLLPGSPRPPHSPAYIVNGHEYPYHPSKYDPRIVWRTLWMRKSHWPLRMLFMGFISLGVFIVFSFVLVAKRGDIYDVVPIPPFLRGGKSDGGSGPLSPTTNAQALLTNILSRQSRNLAQATSRYSLRNNGRLPPPNYDKWFEFANQQRCLIDDYERIWKDFEPFYQVERRKPGTFRERALKMIKKNQDQNLEMKTARVTSGEITFLDNVPTLYNGDWPRTFARFVQYLPDMEFVLSGRDEPRVLFNHRNVTTAADSSDATSVEGANSTIQRALTLSDDKPFEHQPKPSRLWFGDEGRCIVPNRENGFLDKANDASAFLINSASTDFTTDLYPLLSVASISPCFSDILIPSEFYYSDSYWSPKYSYPNNITWEDKVSKLYWRGASSGGYITSSTPYHTFPRFRLIDIGRNNTDIINVAITVFQDQLCGKGCNGTKIVEEYQIHGWGAPREEGYGYKYLVDVDGNSFSGRYFGLLRSGSLVFKSTIFEEYFNSWLRPYVHYIPISPDMSDLVEKVRWAIENDEEAHRIQEAGRLFAEKVLTDEQNDCYFLLALLEWARLFNGGLS